MKKPLLLAIALVILCLSVVVIAPLTAHADTPPTHVIALPTFPSGTQCVVVSTPNTPFGVPFQEAGNLSTDQNGHHIVISPTPGASISAFNGSVYTLQAYTGVSIPEGMCEGQSIGQSYTGTAPGNDGNPYWFVSIPE
jgi:hypothetical protein